MKDPSCCFSSLAKVTPSWQGMYLLQGSQGKTQVRTQNRKHGECTQLRITGYLRSGTWHENRELGQLVPQISRFQNPPRFPRTGGVVPGLNLASFERANGIPVTTPLASVTALLHSLGPIKDPPNPTGARQSYEGLGRPRYLCI